MCAFLQKPAAAREYWILVSGTVSLSHLMSLRFEKGKRNKTFTSNQYAVARAEKENRPNCWTSLSLCKKSKSHMNSNLEHDCILLKACLTESLGCPWLCCIAWSCKDRRRWFRTNWSSAGKPGTKFSTKSCNPAAGWVRCWVGSVHTEPYTALKDNRWSMGREPRGPGKGFLISYSCFLKLMHFLIFVKAGKIPLLLTFHYLIKIRTVCEKTVNI